MNIGIDAKALSKRFTGIGNYLKNIIFYLNKFDRKNIYFLYSNKPIELDFELNDNFIVKNYNFKVGTFGVKYVLPKIVKQDNIDVFWGPEHILPRKIKNIPTVLTVHDLAIFKFKHIATFYNKLIQKLYLKRDCKKATKIVADSIATKNDVVELFKIDANKIDVVYAASTINANGNRDRNCIKKKIDGDYFLYLGTIEPRKNILTLIKAFELFKAKTNSDKKIVLVGGKGWRCESIYEYANNSPYKEDIIFYGYCENEEKVALYANSDGFIFPSLYEGFGIPLLDAMILGVVSITSRNSSLIEVGGDDVFYLDDVNDYEALSELMIKVVNLDEDERNKIVEANKEHSKMFGYDISTKQLIDIFEGFTK